MYWIHTISYRHLPLPVYHNRNNHIIVLYPILVCTSTDLQKTVSLFPNHNFIFFNKNVFNHPKHFCFSCGINSTSMYLIQLEGE